MQVCVGMWGVWECECVRVWGEGMWYGSVMVWVCESEGVE